MILPVDHIRICSSLFAGLMCPIMIRDAVNSFAQHAAAPAAVAAAAATKALLL